MRYPDGKPYRGQVYRLAEIPEVIERYGLPQDWNAEGVSGPDRYIEAQVWADEPLHPYLGRGEKSRNYSPNLQCTGIHRTNH